MLVRGDFSTLFWKRTMSACLLGATVSALTAAQQQPRKSGAAKASVRPMTVADAQRLKAALEAFDSGDLSRAKPVLLELAGRYAGQVEVQGAAGMTLAQMGDVQGALPYLERAHRLAPRDPGFATNLAVAELKTGHAADAVSLLRAAAQAQPADAQARVLLAQAELEAGQPAAAADSFAEADKLVSTTHGSDDADLRHDWALALLRAGRAPEALTVLEASPNKDSGAMQALMGEAAEKSGRYEDAVKHLKRAAELDGSEANLYAYGDELLQHWSFPGAIEIFRYASDRYPGSVPMQMALGISYYGNADYGKAVPVFAMVLAAHPESAQAADLLGRSCNAFGGDQPGCSSLLQFAQTHPESAPASLYAATAILHQPLEKQDIAKAEALLRNALRVDSKLAEAWYQLAVLQQSRNEWPASVDALQHAIAIRPGYPEAHYRMARALSHEGKREEAQQEIALQQKYAAESKAAENKRLQEMITFVTRVN